MTTILPITAVVVGCGGVASYLLPPLIRTFRNSKLLLVDGDTLESRNLDRQLFNEDTVGANKAEALAKLYHGPLASIEVLPRYLHSPDQIRNVLSGVKDLSRVWLLGCVDNHTARRRILETADAFGARAILAGNEMTDAEAFFYQPAWRESKLDPRIYYPEIMTDDRDDPLRPQGCQGEMQEAHPQLALANNSAASHMLHLLWFHQQESSKLDPEFRGFSPVKHSNNFSRIGTTTIGDINNESTN